MSIEVVALAPGRSTVAVAIGQQHMNPFGGLHGGGYTSVIDTAVSWAACCDVSERSGLVSINLKVDFLAPVPEGKVVIKGRCIQAGRKICLVAAGMYSEEGWLAGHGTSHLLSIEQQKAMADVAGSSGSEGFPRKFPGD